MAKFRKKPIVIETIQYFRSNEFEEPLKSHPGIRLCPNTNRDYVITIHGDKAYLTDGDWIIPEPKPGHYYPCKPDIFAATYEPMEPTP